MSSDRRQRGKKPLEAPQLRLDLQRVLTEPPEYPNHPHTFFCSPEGADTWLTEQKHVVNWVLREGRADESKRKRLKKTSPTTEQENHMDTDTDPVESAPKKKAGRTQVYEWTEKYVYDHSGQYRDRRKANLSPSKRRPNRHKESIKTGCTASIYRRKKIGSDQIDIEFGWKHTGHQPGSIKDMSESRLSERVRNWVDSRVGEGLDWGAIKDLIRIDDLILEQLDNETSNGVIPESLRIAQKDIYNAIRRRMSGLAHLDPNGEKSLTLCKEKLEAKGYKVLYEPVTVQASNEKSYVFAMVSPWQQKLIKEYNNIACMDSTHNTCYSVSGKEEKAFLYTIVVKNLATGKGVPAAFMITPSEAQYAVIDWLRWLKVYLGLDPKTWMIDCSDVEAAAIRAVFGMVAIILECLWHVLKAVTEQAKKKLNVKDPPKGLSKAEANRQLRAEGREDFAWLVMAEDAVDFEKIWNEITVSYAEHKEWISYLSGEWMGKKERWALAWRKDKPHYRIETNNYVESWHHHLKVFYLRLMRKQRIDVLLHILTEKVEPDFRRSELCVTMNFEAPTFSKVELRSRKKAYEVDALDAEAMVGYDEEHEDGRSPDLFVQSFTDSECWYTVGVKDFGSAPGADTAIASCSCPDFENNSTTCKHMFLASRISSFPIRRFASTLVKPRARDYLPTEIPTQSAEEVAAEKEASRSRILDELTKINSLAESLADEPLDKISRDQLSALEAQVTRTRRDLSERLNHRPLHATQAP